MASRALLFLYLSPLKTRLCDVFSYFIRYKKVSIDHTPWKTKMIRGSYFQISLPIKLSACKLKFNFTWQKILWDLSFSLRNDKIYDIIIVIVISHARTCLVAFCSNHCFRPVSQDNSVEFLHCENRIWYLDFFAVLDVILPQL